jgi:hypothetical protein
VALVTPAEAGGPAEAVRPRTVMMTMFSRRAVVRDRAGREAFDDDVLDRRWQQPLNAAQQIAIRV